MTTHTLAAPALFGRPQSAAFSGVRRAPAASLALLRCLLLIPLVGAWFVLYELLLRIAIAMGRDSWQERLAAQWARGLSAMLAALLNVRFDISPELRQRACSLRRSIIVANHQSPLDIIAVLLLCPPRPLRFVARAGLARGVPGVSAFLRLPKQVLLAKNDPAANVRALESLGASIETTGDNAIIFPEGAKTPKTYRELRRFKATGLGAIRAGAPSAPIIVLAIGGAHAAWRGAGHLPGRDITVRLELAEEIPPSTSAALDDNALAAACESAVRGALARAA